MITEAEQRVVFEASLGSPNANDRLPDGRYRFEYVESLWQQQRAKHVTTCPHKWFSFQYVEAATTDRICDLCGITASELPPEVAQEPAEASPLAAFRLETLQERQA